MSLGYCDIFGYKSEMHIQQGGKSPVREELLEPIAQGIRNNTMASRIGYLIKKLDEVLAWEAAQHINENCCRPPLEHRELLSIFRSISKRERRNG